MVRVIVGSPVKAVGLNWRPFMDLGGELLCPPPFKALHPLLCSWLVVDAQ